MEDKYISSIKKKYRPVVDNSRFERASRLAKLTKPSEISCLIKGGEVVQFMKGVPSGNVNIRFYDYFTFEELPDYKLTEKDRELLFKRDYEFKSKLKEMLFPKKKPTYFLGITG